MAQTGYTPILLYSSTTAAQAPAAGNLTNSTFGSELAINITDGKLFYKDNANAVQVIAWKTTPTTAGGTGLTSYTAGDLPYYATGTTLSKLAIGSNGQVLTSTGTAPQWTTLSGVAVTTFSAGTTGLTPNSATSGAVTLAGTLITTNGGTGLSSYTAGDLTYYASGTTLTKLAIGASTTILTSSGTAPQWSAASGVTVGTATNLAGGVAGSVPYQTAAGTTAMLAIGVSGRWLGSSGTAPQWNAPAALTKTDDTNVTLTLGGSASTALLNAASLTLGWTGTLAVSRGGTGTATAFTAGSVVFAGASGVYSQDNTSLFWDDTNNYLGVGTALPQYRVQASQANASSTPNQRAAIQVYAKGYGGGGTYYAGIGFAMNEHTNGYWGSGIQALDDTGSYGSALTFSTSSGSATPTPTEKARIFSSGGVSIGNTTDPGTGNLYVNGSLGVGNTPVTTLDITGIATIRNNAAAFNTTPNTNYGLNFQAASSGVCYVTSYSAGGSTSVVVATNSGGGAATERLRVDSLGNIYGTAGATTMTDGFIFASSGAGAPTNTPSTFGGRVPMYYDTTNNKFYVYNGAWKSVALT